MPRGASFDDLARLLVRHASRRTTLHLLAAALITGWLRLQPVATAAPQDRCRKLGKTCSKRQKCCKGTTCVRGRCGCPRSKKRCGRACIARATCCQATEERCQGVCVPKGTCCRSGTGCCANDDCTGPCDTGICGADHRCEPFDAGTLCGPDLIGECDEGGTCAPVACTNAETCPEPPHFCRGASCVANECVAVPINFDEPLPEDEQDVDCFTKICDPNFEQGYALVPNPDACPPGDNP